MEYKTGNVNEEKHVPHVVKRENGYLVKVGKPADHPMLPEHFICEICLEVDGIFHNVKLNPGDKPEHMFEMPHGKVVKAYETCNIHGTWVNEIVE